MAQDNILPFPAGKMFKYNSVKYDVSFNEVILAGYYFPMGVFESSTLINMKLAMGTIPYHNTTIGIFRCNILSVHVKYQLNCSTYWTMLILSKDLLY